MLQSIHFQIKKWDYNKKAPFINTHTDCILRTHPLMSKKDPHGKAAGITFVWVLVLTGEGLEILYYSSEEACVAIKPVTEQEMLSALKNSYDKSSYEVAMKNLSVGLDAGFPAFESIPFDLKEIMKVLDM